jgi:hypothetical protein
MSVPDYRVLCYDASVGHIGRLREKMCQRLAIGVGEGVADDVSICDIGRDCSITVLHRDCGALNSIQRRVQRRKKPIKSVGQEHWPTRPGK